ncbi:NAD(P)-dependent oxidoreductase [Candidatus Gottesmanbacteria bacterium]|nr:NAD(P)-dependent oxidoreductase [Candidatus Gottesmanbacteria bacterium]
MKILVTGSEGYLGVPLTQALLRQGYEIVGLDTGFYRDGWLYNGVKKPPIVIDKDTRKISKKDLIGYDAVIHLGELSNDPLGETDPKTTMDINHRGTVHLIKMAKEIGVARFIYFSSCSVYGSSDNIVDEASPANPLTTYAKCKVLNEKYLLKQASKTFSPVILRLATAFGPSPKMRFDLVVNNLVGIAFTTGTIKMESDGSSWRPFIHTEDIGRAVIAVVNSPRQKTHRQIFNVGSSKSNYQIKDIAVAIKRVLPDCKVSLNPEGKDKRNYRVGFQKIEAALPGFKARISLQDGIEELVKLFGQINLTRQMFESKEFIRIKQIKYLLSQNSIDEKYYWKNI